MPNGTTFTITIRATSILVDHGKEALDLLDPLIENLTYEDEYVEETKTLGWMYYKEKDIVFLHKGVDINYLRKLLIYTDIKYDLGVKPRQMEFEYEVIVPPRNDDQIDVIDFIAGQGYHSNNINESQLFLVKSTGFGKAEPYSRKIPTPTPQGYTLMGDLKVGDYVFDQTGRPTKILQIFEQGEKDVYKVTFNDRRTAYCCEDHLWTVATRQSDQYYTKSLKEIMNDYRKIRPGYEHSDDILSGYICKYHIPACQPVNYPHRDVPIDPWVLGCFIGNGCCLERPLTISSCNDRIPRKIAEICGFRFKKSSKNNYSYTFKYIDGHNVQTIDFFKDFTSQICCKSGNKFIPEIYLVNDVDTRMRLLQGLMDTDGSVSYNNGKYSVLYSSTSKKLLTQIKQLLYSFGFSGTIVEDTRKDKYTSSFCASLVFRVPNTFKEQIFTMDYKRHMFERINNFKQRNVYGHFIIKDITYSHKEQCRCIMVDNPEHLYLTEDFIVTHNTFCTGVGICKYGAKALIIMHRESLRTQWLNSLYNMSGLSSQYVHEITSSEEFELIAHNEHDYDYDVYLLTHATFRAGIKRIGNLDLIMNIPKNLGIGVKVIDEAHLEFRDTLMIDFCFNIKRNLYITATDGRSQRDENSIFKYVFSNVLYYKPSAMLTTNLPKKWVEYYAIEINTNCKPNIYKYRVNGGRGMNPASYGKWVIQYDKKKTHFKCCRDIVKEFYNRDPYSKILLFMPLIDLCEECAYFLKIELGKDPDFKFDLDIRTINSKNSAKDNEYAKGADVIVTTIGSCGTGTDIPGITGIISCTPFVSKINAQQIFGRIRYCGKICQYYDIYDSSVQMDVFWHKSRRKKFKELALNSYSLYWEDDKK